MRYLANCSMLFTERPLLERPAAARAAGFEAVEFWWPWPDRPAPPDADVDAFVRAVDEADVRLVGLNFFKTTGSSSLCSFYSQNSQIFALH